jgi:hypothetical protein
MNDESAVLVVNMIAVTAVAPPFCRAIANTTAAVSPLRTMDQTDGSRMSRHGESGMVSVRAEIPMTLKPRPAPNASAGAAQKRLWRLA